MTRPSPTVLAAALPLAAVLLLSATLPARAFCLTNGADVPVHVMALDASGFEADLPPGRDLCQDAAGPTQILAVTGYVPLAPGRRPGWRAECRIRLAPDGAARITGHRDALACATR
ncbi:MAG: hypothetical protein KDE22_14860 [Rhodobacterales bacterium]|nr:hypothetical protein [Rhodobacterales bacterium]